MLAKNPWIQRRLLLWFHVWWKYKDIHRWRISISKTLSFWPNLSHLVHSQAFYSRQGVAPCATNIEFPLTWICSAFHWSYKEVTEPLLWSISYLHFHLFLDFFLASTCSLNDLLALESKFVVSLCLFFIILGERPTSLTGFGFITNKIIPHKCCQWWKNNAKINSIRECGNHLFLSACFFSSRRYIAKCLRLPIHWHVPMETRKSMTGSLERV